MSIQFIVALNRQGQLRLRKWYTAVSSEQQWQTIRKVHRLVSARDQHRQSNFVEYEGQKLVYKRFNGLFFVVCIDPNDNELSYLEVIPLFIELLDAYFDSVCELDLIFSFYKVYQVLGELVVGGELVECNKDKILARLRFQDLAG